MDRLNPDAKSSAHIANVANPAVLWNVTAALLGVLRAGQKRSTNVGTVGGTTYPTTGRDGSSVDLVELFGSSATGIYFTQSYKSVRMNVFSLSHNYELYFSV